MHNRIRLNQFRQLTNLVALTNQNLEKHASGGVERFQVSRTTI